MPSRPRACGRCAGRWPAATSSAGRRTSSKGSRACGRDPFSTRRARRKTRRSSVHHAGHAGLYVIPFVRQAGSTMFVIELTYKASLARIDASMSAHVRFLKKYYAAGNFLISGRKIPRDGGIILATGRSREQIEAIAREDPFYVRGLADVRIIQFRASQRADDIPERIDA